MQAILTSTDSKTESVMDTTLNSEQAEELANVNEDPDFRKQSINESHNLGNLA